MTRFRGHLNTVKTLKIKRTNRFGKPPILRYSHLIYILVFPSIAMENGTFEDVFSIEHGDIVLLC